MSDNKNTPPVNEAVYLFKHQLGKFLDELAFGHTAIEAFSKCNLPYHFSEANVLQIADVTNPKCEILACGFEENESYRILRLSISMRK